MARDACRPSEPTGQDSTPSPPRVQEPPPATCEAFSVSVAGSVTATVTASIGTAPIERTLKL